MVSPHFRDLTPADAESMLILRAEASSEPLMGPSSHSEHEATSEAVAAWLAAQDRVTIGAFADESTATLLGTCTVRAGKGPGAFGLVGLYVCRRAQGAGLGTALVERCLAHSFASGAVTFVLEVYSPTVGPESKARRIYIKQGFINSWDAEQDKDCPPGLSKNTMHKRIGGDQ